MTASYRKMPAGEYEKARADYMFGKRQYGRAAVRYEEVLEGLEDAGEAGRDSREKEAFRAKLYNNLGAAYAQMFQFHKPWLLMRRPMSWGRAGMCSSGCIFWAALRRSWR